MAREVDADSGAEQALLGALLIDSTSAWSKVAGTVSTADLHRPDHRLIFEAVAELARAGKPADVVTVERELARSGKLTDAGGIAYLATLARDTPTAANVDAYARAVLEDSRRRRLRALSAEAIDQLLSGTSAADVHTHMRAALERIEVGASSPEPLQIEPASAWAQRQAPAPRDWVWEGLIPAGRVTSMLGDGGLGKTTIAAQIAVHVEHGIPLYGVPIKGGPVIGVFCEDEQDELERRVRAVCAAERIELADLMRLHLQSRDGQDNLLCTFERDQIILTPFYQRLETTVERIRPRVLILDTAADLFAGDFMSTPHVRQFLKVGLGGLCARYGCAVLLLAHPSASGMSNGTGSGYSVAWSNSVRSRLYLRRPQTTDKEAVKDRRVLEVRKSNYGPDGATIALIWQHGCFVPDPNPIAEDGKARVARAPTKLALSVLDFMRSKGAAGTIVVSFRAIFDHAKGAGLIKDGAEYETARKPLQRTLGDLVEEGIVEQTSVPRGYRLVRDDSP